jgi:hypothetical protein
MKRIIVSLALVLTAGLTTLFANTETGISDQVRIAFEKEFAGAQSVCWNEEGDYLKATFLMGGHRAEAYYNREAEFLGCIRNLFYDQLPLTLMTSMDKRFAGAGILDVREVNNAEGTTYRLTLEVQNVKYHVKADTGGNILEIQKLKK